MSLRIAHCDYNPLRTMSCRRINPTHFCSPSTTGSTLMFFCVKSVNAALSLASGVTVVTTRLNGRSHGMTANSFASVSLDPPLVLVCVDHAATAHPDFLEHGWFAVNVLRREQEAEQMKFVLQKEQQEAERKRMMAVVGGIP